MIKLILLIFLCSQSLLAQTYSQSAVKHIDDQFSIIERELGLLNHQSSPYSTKQLRKDIGLLKIYVDIFINAYKGPQIIEIRDLLDEGYEIIGNYKDLYDTYDQNQLNEELVSKRRSAALKWKRRFHKEFKKNKHFEYLMNPIKKTSSIQKRSKKDLPKFFWRIVKFPKKDFYNANKVMTKLLNSMIEISTKRLAKIQDFKDLFNIDDENEYHDFRKLIRAHYKLINTFYQEDQLSHRYVIIKEQIKLLISEFGDLNDVLTKLHHTKGKAKKKAIKKKVQKQWNLLKQYIIDHKIAAQLAHYRL